MNSFFFILYKLFKIKCLLTFSYSYVCDNLSYLLKMAPFIQFISSSIAFVCRQLTSNIIKSFLDMRYHYFISFIFSYHNKYYTTWPQMSRQRKRDYDVLPYISPRSESGHMRRSHQSHKSPPKRNRAISAPSKKGRRPISVLSSNFEDEDEEVRFFLLALLVAIVIYLCCWNKNQVFR